MARQKVERIALSGRHLVWIAAQSTESHGSRIGKVFLKASRPITLGEIVGIDRSIGVLRKRVAGAGNRAEYATSGIAATTAD